MNGRPRLAVYWASSCGGCEIAIVNLHEKLLEVDAAFELVFCPCLLDTKKKDIEAMPDASIALTLFNGSLRTEENAEMARLLRRKSRILAAYGSCAYEGCIPGLANLSRTQDILETSFLDSPSLDNPGHIIPSPETAVPEGSLHLSPLLENVLTLEDAVEVDYYIPGCPPEPARIWDVLDGIIHGSPLPPPRSVMGAGTKAVCDECTRIREDRKIQKLYRTWELVPDPHRCLLDQGIICMGIATRNGCGALCPKVNMPCTGCYGTPDGVLDQGAKMIAALGSLVDVGALKGIEEEEVASRIAEVMAQILDPAGTFYKYSLPRSLLRGRVS